jgi:hypothetical protein
MEVSTLIHTQNFIIAFVGGTEGFLKCTIFVFSKFTFNALCLHHVLRISISNCKDYNEMAKAVARSTGRALSLPIVKSKAHGGFNFDTYTKLYDSLVWSVISYGAAIWG